MAASSCLSLTYFNAEAGYWLRRLITCSNAPAARRLQLGNQLCTRQISRGTRRHLERLDENGFSSGRSNSATSSTCSKVISISVTSSRLFWLPVYPAGAACKARTRCGCIGVWSTKYAKRRESIKRDAREGLAPTACCRLGRPLPGQISVQHEDRHAQWPAECRGFALRVSRYLRTFVVQTPSPQDRRSPGRSPPSQALGGGRGRAFRRKDIQTRLSPVVSAMPSCQAWAAAWTGGVTRAKKSSAFIASPTTASNIAS